MRRLALSLALGLFSLAAAGPAPAVTITIVNTDASGQGLNDQTPATPVGGNPGTTIGQQRLNVFREAARIWGQTLPGNVEIKVDASFAPLDCTANSAVLARSGPAAIWADFTGAPVAGTWYVVAEANQLAGEDLEAGQSHISSTFNSKLGQSGCFAGYPFYYGFDTNAPSGDVNFLTVALHEFTHGLGFIPLADKSTGELCCAPTVLPDIFDAFVYDTTKAKSWNQMTSDADRQASAINTGNLVWNGPAANAAGAAYLAAGVPALVVSSPAAAVGSYAVGRAEFGPPLTAPGVTGTLVATNPSDPGGSTSTDGCSALANPSAVAGKIALINRGTCNFTVKVKNAQNAGAIAVVIQDYSSSVPPDGLGGADASITIPSVRVAQPDGAKLRANLPATVTIGLDMTQRAGMNANGQLLLYAPNPVEPGSSVSHWDTSAYPNLLMEPNVNDDLPIGLDITPEALRDIGWFEAPPTSATYYYLPSVAHTAGGTPTAPAFFTSDFFVANEGTSDANVTLKFLGHDVDGTSGAEQSLTVPAGQAVTYGDVLGSAFGLTSGNSYGAIRIAADSTYLKISSVTTTPTPDQTGAYGQSVPAVRTSQLITHASPGAIAGIREDATARTNLVLLNATTQSLDAQATLRDDSGINLGTLTQTLPPLGMTQIGRIIEKITGARNTSNATLTLSTTTSGGAFTAFASLVNNGTNDPATLLPGAGLGAGSTTYMVPSVARTAGGTPTAPAFYTSDLFVANEASQTAHYTLKYLAANTPDGNLGPTRNFTLSPGQADTFRDVLGSVFGLSSNSDFGALEVTGDASALVIDSVTTTPAPLPSTGRFGQSVPGVPSSGWILNGATGTIVGVREDATARTNLVLVSGTSGYSIEIDYALYADNGTQLGSNQTVTLPPLGMKQIGRVIETITHARNTSNATLVLWTPTVGGTFTAFASLLNNVTNDPATLLPQ